MPPPEYSFTDPVSGRVDSRTRTPGPPVAVAALPVVGSVLSAEPGMLIPEFGAGAGVACEPVEAAVDATLPREGLLPQPLSESRAAHAATGRTSR